MLVVAILLWKRILPAWVCAVAYFAFETVIYAVLALSGGASFEWQFVVLGIGFPLLFVDPSSAVGIAGLGANALCLALLLLPGTYRWFRLGQEAAPLNHPAELQPPPGPDESPAGGSTKM